MARADFVNGAAISGEGKEPFISYSTLYPEHACRLLICPKSRSHEWVKKYDNKSLHCQRGQRSMGGKGALHFPLLAYTPSMLTGC